MEMILLHRLMHGKIKVQLPALSEVDRTAESVTEDPCVMLRTVEFHTGAEDVVELSHAGAQ